MPDTDQAVRVLLHAAADPPGGPLHAPVDAVLLRARRRQHRRRGVLLGGIAAVTALAVAVPVLVVSDRGGSVNPAQPTPTASVNQHGTVAALATDTWRGLPASPLTPRDGAAAVWTGQELLLWGGEADRKGPYADGATYDPLTQHWQPMARSPLSARSYPATAWTSKGAFIWGGYGTAGTVNDGAVYDVATRRWQLLPKAPLPNGVAEATVNAAGQVVVVSALPVQAAMYNPATNSWTRLPAPPTDRNKSVESIRIAAAGNSVYLVSSWSHSHATSPNSVETSAGSDVLVLRDGARAWQPVTAPEYSIPNVTPFWTGRVLVWPPAEPFRPAISEGPPSLTPGMVLDPGSGAWRQMGATPGSGEAFAPLRDASWVWTGSALVGVFGPPGIYAGSPPAKLNGGAAIAWDAASDQWSVLAPPTVPLGGTAEVWTGRELLLWGTVLRPSEPEKPGTTPSPQPPAAAQGLALGP